ncbi:MAG TPA: MarR family transcriptional regulator [Euryarchaeota archaeon]|nr:MarR family transcriptional regulator [Euryarchaeota archaeon]
MGLEQELERFYSSVRMSELRFSGRFGSDVDYRSLLYLDLIRYEEGCTASKISEMLGVDKSTVSKKIDSLVARGMAVKVRDPDDGRIQRLALSEEWRTMYDENDAPYDRVLERLETELSDSEKAVVCRALGIFSEELDRE